MTDLEINEAIANAIGRRYHKPTYEEVASGSYYQYEPDFTNDLNAIHSIEGNLNESQRNRYRFFLCEILDVKTAGDGWRVINATARQKTEAYLRTVNLWK